MGALRTFDMSCYNWDACSQAGCPGCDNSSRYHRDQPRPGFNYLEGVSALHLMICGVM